jgi:hypothetical protein
LVLCTHCDLQAQARSWQYPAQLQASLLWAHDFTLLGDQPSLLIPQVYMCGASHVKRLDVTDALVLRLHAAVCAWYKPQQL